MTTLPVYMRNPAAAKSVREVRQIYDHPYTDDRTRRAAKREARARGVSERDVQSWGADRLFRPYLADDDGAGQ